jgi:SAM-dependent methyltransferase
MESKGQNGDWVKRLSEKWHEIPVSVTERESSAGLLDLPDREFLSWWEDQERSMRDFYWPIDVYQDYVRGRKLIEVGPGTGIVGVNLLRAGATITFLDVAVPNLRLIERICQVHGLQGASFFLLTDFHDPLKLPDDYDCVLAMGSLHHAPSEIAKPEFEALASRLKMGGRFLALAYPKQRWERDGRMPFSEWGKTTDGEATPWAEWYDEAKFLAQLSPYRFRTIMAFNFHNNGFNWFDFKRIG